MFNRSIIKRNIITFSIILFVVIYLVINNIKPNFLYTNNGHLRSFGLNYKNKTIIPLWLLAIFIAIISYISILYYITYPKINY